MSCVPHLVQDGDQDQLDDDEVAVRLHQLSLGNGGLPPLTTQQQDAGRGAAQTRRDEQAAEYVRTIGSTVYHPCGTCRMGEDDGAVVDSQLRVRRIDGLRVVDASVMPAMPSPNIHPATIMVAEKSSDIIARTLAN